MSQKKARRRYKALAKKYDDQHPIIFLRFFTGFSLNADALCIMKYIVFNDVWEICMCHEQEDFLQAIFLQTFGHEIAHKEGDFSIIKYFLRERKLSYIFNDNSDKRFIHWTTEIHHDFIGALFSGNTDSEKIKDIIEYKKYIIRILKGPLVEKKDCNTHPNWDFRKECLLSGTFDESIVRKIACRAGCDNEELINEILLYYGKIKLK